MNFNKSRVRSIAMMIIVGFVQCANASGGFQSTKLAYFYQDYTGLPYYSFAESGPGQGGEISLDDGGEHIRRFFKIRINSTKGRQDFRKNGVTFFSQYQFNNFESEVGGSIFPISRDDKGINLFLWGGASLSYNYLVIEDIPSTVSLEKKSPAFGYGYGFGIGLEYMLFVNKNNRKVLMFTEVGFRDTRAPIGGQSNFQISGLVYTIGIGF